MKSLLDIQQDIRKLENCFQEISKDIKSINADIDDLRNSSEVDAFDFNTIDILSKHVRFDTHPLHRLKEGNQCRVYLEMLLNIARLDNDQETTVKRMVFIQWLQRESLIDWSLEDLYKDTFKHGKEIYYEIADEIPRKYRDYFILDSLIVSNIAGVANRGIQEYIVDLAAILGIDDVKLKTLATVAKVVLCQNVSSFSRDQIRLVLDYSKLFRYYLQAEIIEQAIIALRVVDVELADSDAQMFKWAVKNLENVKAGDVIATYMKEKKRSRYSRSSIKDLVVNEVIASESGTLYQFRNERVNYGVIAHKTDNKDSIKEWIKRGRV